MIFTTDGTPLQGTFPSIMLRSVVNVWYVGITRGFSIDRRVEVILSPKIQQKGTFDFVIESSCNGMFGVPWNGDTMSPCRTSSIEFGSDRMAYGFCI